MRKINGVAVCEKFPRHFLRNIAEVEQKSRAIRNDLDYRAAVDHPDPNYRAEPGDLESARRSYAGHGYDPQGYPQGWTGPREVPADWKPRTWKERNTDNTQRGRSHKSGLKAATDVAVRWCSNPTRRGKRVAATPELVEYLICEAWQELGPPHAGYAPLTYMRPRVQELAVHAGVRVADGEDQGLREVVDGVLFAMIKTGDAHLVPDSSWARNHPVHKAAAIKVGRENKNWLLIEDTYFEASGWRKTGKRWVR